MNQELLQKLQRQRARMGETDFALQATGAVGDGTEGGQRSGVSLDCDVHVKQRAMGFLQGSSLHPRSRLDLGLGLGAVEAAKSENSSFALGFWKEKESSASTQQQQQQPPLTARSHTAGVGVGVGVSTDGEGSATNSRGPSVATSAALDEAELSSSAAAEDSNTDSDCESNSLGKYLMANAAAASATATAAEASRSGDTKGAPEKQEGEEKGFEKDLEEEEKGEEGEDEEDSQQAKASKSFASSSSTSAGAGGGPGEDSIAEGDMQHEAREAREERKENGEQEPHHDAAVAEMVREGMEALAQNDEDDDEEENTAHPMRTQILQPLKEWMQASSRTEAAVAVMARNADAVEHGKPSHVILADNDAPQQHLSGDEESLAMLEDQDLDMFEYDLLDYLDQLPEGVMGKLKGSFQLYQEFVQDLRRKNELLKQRLAKVSVASEEAEEEKKEEAQSGGCASANEASVSSCGSGEHGLRARMAARDVWKRELQKQMSQRILLAQESRSRIAAEATQAALLAKLDYTKKVAHERIVALTRNVEAQEEGCRVRANAAVAERERVRKQLAFAQRDIDQTTEQLESIDKAEAAGSERRQDAEPGMNEVVVQHAGWPSEWHARNVLRPDTEEIRDIEARCAAAPDVTAKMRTEVRTLRCDVKLHKTKITKYHSEHHRVKDLTRELEETRAALARLGGA